MIQRKSRANLSGRLVSFCRLAPTTNTWGLLMRNAG
jgi:hypothetical protein